jgi:hypothetical protein
VSGVWALPQNTAQLVRLLLLQELLEGGEGRQETSHGGQEASGGGQGGSGAEGGGQGNAVDTLVEALLTGARGQGQREGAKGAGTGGRGSEGGSAALFERLVRYLGQQEGGSGREGAEAGQGAGKGGEAAAAEGAEALVTMTEAELIAKAQEEFARELTANLRRLKEVIQESQNIAKKMEAVLGKTNQPRA